MSYFVSYLKFKRYTRIVNWCAINWQIHVIDLGNGQAFLIQSGQFDNSNTCWITKQILWQKKNIFSSNNIHTDTFIAVFFIFKFYQIIYVWRHFEPFFHWRPLCDIFRGQTIN